MSIFSFNSFFEGKSLVHNIMYSFKLIIFSILYLLNLSFASGLSLLEGTYVDQISQDSIYLEKAGDEYKLESTNGNIILFPC